MISVKDLTSGDNFFLMAGPCVIEGEDMALRIAERVVTITNKLGIPYIFKGSYRKANRSRIDQSNIQVFMVRQRQHQPASMRYAKTSDC